MLLYSNLPTTPVFGLRRELDRMFDDVFGRNAATQTGWTPAADIREDDGGYTFEAEIPGVDPQHVHVTADEGVLTIRGERAATEAKENGQWHVAERVYGAFTRSFRLPPNTDENGIEASFAHGVLTVRVPKTKMPEPRRIEVRTK